ncbi:hypothetical protein [Actinomadura formosensis]|uniref:hypothetical protein n=1 Tax=Actinomadura formosensis TaxID=60706 RepID=UPI000832FDA9|nr:hypothetical protein [Actinomadura formosensis]
MTGENPAGSTINLSKEPPPARPGPAWIVVPARIVALVIVLPLRLVHDLFVQAGRGARAVWRRLTRAPGRLARLIGRMLRGLWLALYGRLLAPLGRLVMAIGRGIGALLDLLVVRPLRWLAIAMILGFLRRLGRGSGRLGRWLHRVLIAPVGRFLALLGRGLGRVLEFVLLRPLRWLGQGPAWLLAVTGRGFMLLFQGIALLIGVLVVMPAVLLWRYVLRPPLLGLARLGRGVLFVLGTVGSVLASGLYAFASAIVWSWRLLGRCLRWLGRVLVVLPARAVRRHLLAPVAAGAAGTWRLATRMLRRLGRTFIVAPARAVRTSVLRPIGDGIRKMWRVSVREPVRSARQAMREAGRDVRLTLRRAFRGH